MYRVAERKVAVIGLSQGGLLPRFALTYWPDLRRKVGDLLAVAAPQHGTPPLLKLGEIVVSEGCTEATPCKPAIWQQERGSNLLDALNGRGDETPGPVSYTTVRSLTDETVRPTSGKRPSAALDGARNILIQDLCPGRETTHVGSLVDSVTFAALFDAVETKGRGKDGAAKPSRLPADVCGQPYAPGLDEALTALGIEIGPTLSAAQMTAEPKAVSEPRVQRVFRDAKVNGTATAKGSQRQKGKRIVVQIKVKAGEDVDARGTGKVLIKNPGQCLVARETEGCKKGYKLKRVDKSVGPGEKKTLKLTPTNTGKKKLAEVVEKGRKATAKLKVKLDDKAGNTETTKLKVKLKR